MSESPSAQRFIIALMPFGNFGLIVLAVLAALVGQGNLRADEALPLPGHYMKLNETAKHCYGALVATLEKVTIDEPGPSGAEDYTSRWKVKQVLRGDYAPETSLWIRIQSFPKFDAEAMPEVNKTYILVGYGPEIDHQQIAIILENTPGNLENVKKLLQK